MLDLSKFENAGIDTIPLTAPNGNICLCYQPRPEDDEILTVFGASFYDEASLQAIVNQCQIDSKHISLS